MYCPSDNVKRINSRGTLVWWVTISSTQPRVHRFKSYQGQDHDSSQLSHQFLFNKADSRVILESLELSSQPRLNNYYWNCLNTSHKRQGDPVTKFRPRDNLFNTGFVKYKPYVPLFLDINSWINSFMSRELSLLLLKPSWDLSEIAKVGSMLSVARISCSAWIISSIKHTQKNLISPVLMLNNYRNLYEWNPWQHRNKF